MKRVIVSDIHLGDVHAARATAILKIILNSEWDQLILNGDLWDLWKTSADELVDSHADILSSLSEQLRKNKSIIYIVGNHDDKIRKHLQLVPIGIEVCNEYSFKDEALGLVKVIHGHQYDWTQQHRLFAVVIVKLQNWIDRTLNTDVLSWLVAKLGLSPRKWSNALVTAYKATQQNKDVDTVVIGHTHFPGSMKFKTGPTLWNCGDLVENCSYLILESNQEPVLVTHKEGE